MFSSVPPNQYCITKNQARKSWALPGIYFKILGNRRSIRIFFSPVSEDGFEEPLNFFNSATAPLSGACISSDPIRVSFTRSASQTTPIIASHFSLLAFNNGKIGLIWSSRKRRFTIIISDVSIAALVSARALGFSPHSAAAKIETSRPLKSLIRLDQARSHGIALCESNVIIEIRYEFVSAGLLRRLSSIMSLSLI